MKTCFDKDCETNVTDADVVVMALCEDHYSSGENACISHISISDYEKSILKRARVLGKKLVGVFFYGRPIAMQGVAEWFDAILYAWHGGSQVAGAAADILFADRLPSAKSPVIFPRLATHLPLYYNCYSSGHEVNCYYGEYSSGCYRDSHAAPYYPFGYGLTYSEMRYGKPTCGKPLLCMDELEEGDKFNVSIEVENIGEYNAEEIVQLYISDKVAKASRPIRELKAFKKVFIGKSERVRGEFCIGKGELGYYDKNGKFAVEPGEFDIYIGENCLTENKITVELT